MKLPAAPVSRIFATLRQAGGVLKKHNKISAKTNYGFLGSSAADQSEHIFENCYRNKEKYR